MAAVAGYLVGSSWALLIATPFVAYGLSNISSPGPLENTDSGWGGIILLIVALPVATCTTLGVIISLALSAEPESVNQKSI